MLQHGVCSHARSVKNACSDDLDDNSAVRLMKVSWTDRADFARPSVPTFKAPSVQLACERAGDNTRHD